MECRELWCLYQSLKYKYSMCKYRCLTYGILQAVISKQSFVLIVLVWTNVCSLNMFKC